MKVLTTYLSQTGNTQQIAEAIHQELSGSHDADLAKVEEVSADSLGGYDVIFVGSPIHGNGLAAPVSELMGAMPEGLKVAGFVTHASFAYEKEGFEAGMQSFNDISKEKNLSFLGVFDCEGRMAPMLQPMIQEARGVSDEEWAERMAKLDQHPNTKDEQKAKDFAGEVMAKAQP